MCHHHHQNHRDLLGIRVNSDGTLIPEDTCPNCRQQLENYGRVISCYSHIGNQDRWCGTCFPNTCKHCGNRWRDHHVFK